MTRTLVVRLDNAGDVLLAGPAVRAIAASSSRVLVLCGPRGRPAAELLPGVDAIVEFDAPWIADDASPFDPHGWDDVVRAVRGLSVDRAAVLTSFHQSSLPAAILLRLAGVGEIAAPSVDFPGSLLDHRLDPPDHLHEVERGLHVVAALGVPVERTLVVGDIGADVWAARAAGARGVLVPNDRTSPVEIALAPRVVADLDGLVELVNGCRR